MNQCRLLMGTWPMCCVTSWVSSSALPATAALVDALVCVFASTQEVFSPHSSPNLLWTAAAPSIPQNPRVVPIPMPTPTLHSVAQLLPLPLSSYSFDVWENACNGKGHRGVGTIGTSEVLTQSALNLILNLVHELVYYVQS